MPFINTETGKYPVSEREIRAMHPDTSFPTPFKAPAEFAVVFPAPQPEHDAWTQGVREIAPVLTAKGTYEQSWEVYAIEHTPEEVAAEVERLKAAKLREILTKSDEAMDSLTASYSDNEKLSWPKQEAEAKALLTAPDASAPLLRGIAAARGIPLEKLRDKVLANVSVSEQATALILGTQQKYEDAVRAAETVEAVQGIEVDYAQ